MSQSLASSSQQENELRERSLQKAATLETVPFTRGRGEIMPVTFALKNGDYLTATIPTVFVQEAIDNKPSQQFLAWIQLNAKRLQPFPGLFAFHVNNLYISVCVPLKGKPRINVDMLAT